MNCELNKDKYKKVMCELLRNHYYMLEKNTTKKMKNYLREMLKIKEENVNGYEYYDDDTDERRWCSRETFELEQKMILNDLEMNLAKECKKSAYYNERCVHFNEKLK